MSESRVHPVISRYSFVPGGNSIKGEPRARARAVPLALSSLIFSSLPLSLSLSLSRARARRLGREGNARNEPPRRHLDGSGGNTVVRDQTSSKVRGRDGEGAVILREKESRAVTHGRIELFIVMAGSVRERRAQRRRRRRRRRRCVWVSRASGKRGEDEGPPLRPDSCPPRCAGRRCLLFSSSASLSRARALRAPGTSAIYKYRYRALGATAQSRLEPGPPHASLSLSLSLSLSDARARAPFLPYAALCRGEGEGPSAAYAYATGRPLPVYPAGCPTPTYMAAAQLYPSG